MVMEEVTLEVTVISAEGLTVSRRPVEKNAFVRLSTDLPHQACTRPDADGGSYPRWDEKLRLPLPPVARSILVEVLCKARGSNERKVGAASVPISDFYGGVLPAGYLHCLSYRLRDSQGERNGIINLSIRVHVPRGPPPPPLLPQPETTPPPLLPQPETTPRPLWAPGGKAGGEIAIGIPVQHV
ncbi:hypothetical protein Taro_050568 [Colocasia esculenta]|uniref:C2 domain-containing protein n=1 Tax=Colocasia esculenta TaxID=4460 RepID=A0A843XDS0_COLES|nr:hypothetical protein [Colocasia esculenta]